MLTPQDKSDYLHLISPHVERPQQVTLEAVDSAAGQLLISGSAFATSHSK